MDGVIVDTDQAVVDAEGRRIADIVAREGWNRFRLMEKQVLEKQNWPSEFTTSNWIGGGSRAGWFTSIAPH